jgi:hypothetical protein
MTIHSSRFSEPRYLEFEQKGKCRHCKSGTVDIEYYVEPKGVGIYSSRFDGPQYVSFDHPADLPGKCIFRVKNKGQSYVIPFESNLEKDSSAQRFEQLARESNLEKDSSAQQDNNLERDSSTLQESHQKKGITEEKVLQEKEEHQNIVNSTEDTEQMII